MTNRHQDRHRHRMTRHIYKERHIYKDKHRLTDNKHRLKIPIQNIMTKDKARTTIQHTKTWKKDT